MTVPGSESASIPATLNRGEVFYFLKSRKASDRADLLARVRALRDRSDRNRVRALGLIALSSNCIRDCIFCGFRADSPLENMFRLMRSEILAAAETAAAAGIRRLILRCGLDPAIGPDAVAELVRELVSSFGFEIDLSLSERDPASYQAWRQAGANGYWLFRDTCDPHIYRRLRPSMHWVERDRNFEAIRRGGYRLGTGILLGMPNQSFESLGEDLAFFADPGVEAAVIEPYLPPPDAPGYSLLQRPENLIVSTEPPVMEKAIAIARLLRPDLLIPLTNAHARAYGAPANDALFRAGANAVIFDFTPPEYAGLHVSAPLIGFPAEEGRALVEVERSLASQGYQLVREPN